MECKDTKGNEKRGRRRKKSFIEALKEKYIVEDEPKFNFIVVSPKRKNNTAELGHLRAVALNEMDVTRADIPQQGLTSLCPNVVDLDLANNLLEKWSELLVILSHLPKLKYVNVSRNKLQLDNTEVLSQRKLPVENLALNDTGMPVEDVVRLSQIMPTLKELHLCDNNYEDLADIEKKIKEGALSTLECLRLNNNELSSWSEVWKLRHLPHLKYLILSGNPVSDVFYSTEVSTEDSQPEAASTTECHTSSGVDGREKGQVSALSSPCSGSDTDLEEGESGLDADFCLVLDKTEESDEVLLDALDNGDEGEEAEEDFDWSNDVTRPVSRFGRHTESECSTECSSEQGGGGSESDEPMSTQAYDIFSMSPHDEPSDSNSNNSRRRNHYADPWSDSAFADTPFDDFVLEDVADTEGHATDDNNAEAEDWHRRAAETFLFDIIENLTFEGPSLNQGNMGQQLDARTEASVKCESSNTEAERMFMSACGSTVDFGGQDQLQRLSGVKSESGEVTLSTHQDILSATHGYDRESSETISVFGNCMQTEANFIPRAVSMLDEDELTSFLQSRLACPAPSRAQRALFKEPCLNSNNNKCSQGHRHKCTPSCAEPQCQANSCSQCEVGQDQCEDRLQGSHLFHDERSGRTDTHQQSVQGEEKVDKSARSTDRLGESVHKTESHSPDVSSQSIHVCDVTDDRGDGVDFTLQPPLLPSHDDISQPVTHDQGEDVTRSNTQPLSNTLSTHDTQQTYQHHLQQQQQQQGLADNSCDVGAPDQAEPFQQLQILCLSNANLQEWRHLQAFSFFPKLNNIRLKSNPLYSSVHPDDRRKLYIASLPRVSVFNGSEVSNTEREKAENFYLRYFMDKEDKPDFYHTLVKKHGPPVKLVDIDLSAGYHEWANLRFMWNGVEKFTRKIHLVEPVAKLRTIISQTLGLPKRCFIMYHFLCGPSHPESERELIELRCESLPMSRFDFAEGDEIHIDVQD